METDITRELKRRIRLMTRKIGVWGCFEVTIGKERVDYMTLDTKGVWRCYEVKASKADFHSHCAHTFMGNFNYYVMPASLYEELKDEIPKGIGVTDGRCTLLKPKRRDLAVADDVLKTCMLRSLYRYADKLYMTNDEHTLDNLRTEAAHARQLARTANLEYAHLMRLIINKYGRNALRELTTD